MRDEDGDGKEDRDAARPAEPWENADDQTEDDCDEEHRHVDGMERRREPAGEVAKDLHLEREDAGFVKEALGEADAETELEDREDDDREGDRDRPDPPDLIAP